MRPQACTIAGGRSDAPGTASSVAAARSTRAAVSGRTFGRPCSTRSTVAAETRADFFGTFGLSRTALLAPVGLLFYRKPTWRGLVEAARETVHSSASVMLIVGSATLFAWMPTLDQVS